MRPISSGSRPRCDKPLAAPTAPLRRLGVLQGKAGFYRTHGTLLQSKAIGIAGLQRIDRPSKGFKALVWLQGAIGNREL
jgi:hypothetical protein